MLFHANAGVSVSGILGCRVKGVGSRILGFRVEGLMILGFRAVRV